MPPGPVCGALTRVSPKMASAWSAAPAPGARVVASTSSGAAGAWLRSGSPARWWNTAGARSHSPRQGLRTQHASCPVPSGPSASVSAVAMSSPPYGPQATSSQTWTTRGARGSTENIA